MELKLFKNPNSGPSNLLKEIEEKTTKKNEEIKKSFK